MKYSLSLLSAVLLVSSGCGKAVPDGYARVKVGLGGGGALLDAGPYSLSAYPSNTPCTLPHFRVEVRGPDITPVIQDLTVTSMIANNYFNAASGANLFDTPPEADMLVPLGTVRNIFVHGMFYNLCTIGGSSYAVQIGGVAFGQSITSSTFNLNIAAVAQNFVVGQVGNTNIVFPTVSLPMVPVQVAAITNAPQATTYSMDVNLSDNYLLTPVAIASVIPSTRAYQMQPMIPNHRYRLTFTDANANTHALCFDTVPGGAQGVQLDWVANDASLTPQVCGQAKLM